MRTIMKWTALFDLLAGCRAKPPTVADLHFPVAVIFGNSSVVTFKDAAALGTMLIANLNAVTDPPANSLAPADSPPSFGLALHRGR